MKTFKTAFLQSAGEELFFSAAARGCLQFLFFLHSVLLGHAFFLSFALPVSGKDAIKKQKGGRSILPVRQ